MQVPLCSVADLSWLLLLMTFEPCLAYLSQALYMCSPSQILGTSHPAAAQTVALAHFVYVSVCCDAAASLSDSQISVYFVLSCFGDAFAAQIFVHFVCSRSDVAFGAGILVSSHIVELVDVLAFPDLFLCYASV